MSTGQGKCLLDILYFHYILAMLIHLLIFRWPIFVLAIHTGSVGIAFPLDKQNSYTDILYVDVEAKLLLISWLFACPLDPMKMPMRLLFYIN